jgi:hypothetical protein
VRPALSQSVTRRQRELQVGEVLRRAARRPGATEAANLLIGLLADYERLAGPLHPLTQKTRQRLFMMGVHIS